MYAYVHACRYKTRIKYSFHSFVALNSQKFSSKNNSCKFRNMAQNENALHSYEISIHREGKEYDQYQIQV